MSNHIGAMEVDFLPSFCLVLQILKKCLTILIDHILLVIS
jgi:hypothetical protein